MRCSYWNFKYWKIAIILVKWGGQCYPVTKYHTLIIPKRHVADYFELSREEVDAMQELLYRQKERLQQLDKTITGFNIGFSQLLTIISFRKNRLIKK